MYVHVWPRSSLRTGTLCTCASLLARGTVSSPTAREPAGTPTESSSCSCCGRPRARSWDCCSTSRHAAHGPSAPTTPATMPADLAKIRPTPRRELPMCRNPKISIALRAICDRRPTPANLPTFTQRYPGAQEQRKEKKERVNIRSTSRQPRPRASQPEPPLRVPEVPVAEGRARAPGTVVPRAATQHKNRCSISSAVFAGRRVVGVELV